MIRDLDRLAGRTFDLLVVGGGIYGLTIAYDASQRGFSGGLLEGDALWRGAEGGALRASGLWQRYVCQSPSDDPWGAPLSSEAGPPARPRIDERTPDPGSNCATCRPSPSGRGPRTPILVDRQNGHACWIHGR